MKVYSELLEYFFIQNTKHSAQKVLVNYRGCASPWKTRAKRYDLPNERFAM